MVKFYKNVFAQSGDRAPVPNDIQPSGSVSYDEGYGFDYQRDIKTDPAAKPYPRDQSNQITYDIVANIQQYQTHGIPEFITTADNDGTPYPYSKLAYVRYNPGSGYNYYMSLVDSNTTLPTNTTNWQVGRGRKSTTITTSGSFIVPSDVFFVYVTAIAGGGGGGGSGGVAGDNILPVASGGGGGGGAGNGVFMQQVAVTPGETLTVTIGTAGTGGSAGDQITNGAAGIAGGNTQVLRGVTSLILVSGGGGGSGSQFAGVGRRVSGGGGGGSIGGQPGSYGSISYDAVGGLSESLGGIGGIGGSSIVGVNTSGGVQVHNNFPGSPGNNATGIATGGYGNGGGGASGAASVLTSAGGGNFAGATGGNGSQGVVIISF